MKNFLAIAAFAALCVATTAHAASLSFTQVGANNFAVYLDGETDAFDAFQLTITPEAGVTFANITGGVGRPAGDAFTYRNRVLDSDPLDGGKGWLVAGSTINANTLSYGVVAPGSTINTATEVGPPAGKLFLANLLTSGGSASAPHAMATVQLVNASVSVGGPISIPVGEIPEPASLGLAGMALVGLAGLRRRLA